MTRTASLQSFAQTDFCTDACLVDNSEIDIPDGHIITRVRAISARVNRNFDGFSSEELKKAYQTFVGKPVYVNHVNHDINRTRGRVVGANWHEHEDDKFIECVMAVDSENFPQLAQEILLGNLDSVSMGCSIEKSRCSYCNVEAIEPEDFCEHILYNKGEYLTNDDGEEVLVWEDCMGVSFFELSYVFDPADETAIFQEVRVANRKDENMSKASSKRKVTPPRVKAGKLVKRAAEEVTAPADVDTLRGDEPCPQCGDIEAWNGKVCELCDYVAPIEELDDPDTSKAKDNDLEVVVEDPTDDDSDDDSEDAEEADEDEADEDEDEKKSSNKTAADVDEVWVDWDLDDGQDARGYAYADDSLTEIELVINPQGNGEYEAQVLNGGNLIDNDFYEDYDAARNWLEDWWEENHQNHVGKTAKKVADSFLGFDQIDWEDRGNDESSLGFPDLPYEPDVFFEVVKNKPFYVAVNSNGRVVAEFFADSMLEAKKKASDWWSQNNGDYVTASRKAGSGQKKEASEINWVDGSKNEDFDFSHGEIYGNGVRITIMERIRPFFLSITDENGVSVMAKDFVSFDEAKSNAQSWWENNFERYSDLSAINSFREAMKSWEDDPGGQSSEMVVDKYTKVVAYPDVYSEPSNGSKTASVDREGYFWDTGVIGPVGPFTSLKKAKFAAMDFFNNNKPARLR